MSAASARPLPTHRDALLARLRSEGPWDVAVIGGGATGLGIALDAALRGFRVVLLEAVDFASGTSWRSTTSWRAAQASALPRGFPVRKCAVRCRACAGKTCAAVFSIGTGNSTMRGWRWRSRARRPYTARCCSTTRQSTTRCTRAGGLRAWWCATRKRAPATGCTRAALSTPPASGWMRCARSVDAAGAAPRPLVVPSQGVHLVVDADFMPGEHALLVPATQDGRVLFAIPWLGKLVLGTTDTPRRDLPREPLPLPEEVDFILREGARYLERAPTWADVRSCWVGLRPLVSPPSERGADTRSISREHYIETAADGLVTVTGGKWTTYRAMAEDVLQHCMAGKLLPRREAGATRGCRLVGAEDSVVGPIRGADPSGARGPHAYGSEASWVAALPGPDRLLGPGLSEAMVRFAARHEYARTVEDVLARRQRLLFTDAAEAARAAPAVARVLEEETGCPALLEPFLVLAAQYL